MCEGVSSFTLPHGLQETHCVVYSILTVVTTVLHLPYLIPWVLYCVMMSLACVYILSEMVS